MSEWVWPGARIVRVVDGDTFVALLRRDLGFHGTVEFMQRLRLEGLNTPPLNTAPGKAAAIYVKDGWLEVPVTIATGKPYKYGDEWMAVVTRDGLCLNDELVRLGHAEPWTGRGPRPGG